MKETFIELLNYSKNPILEKDDNTSLNYRLKIFIKILLFCVIVGALTTPIFVLFEELGWINLENHKVDEMFKDMPLYQVIFLGGILVPFIEELLFRAPITLFKKSFNFKIAYYCFAIIFGLIHITNFEITTIILVLTPFLILPQLFAGFALGFLRVRFGLVWSILLHCLYNTFFLTISMISEM
jgi:membrane protease YdiL (CAAX protease family)